MTTIDEIANALVYESRNDSTEQWYIKNEQTDGECTEFIREFICENIADTYTTLLNLDLQYKMFADVVHAIGEFGGVKDYIYTYEFAPVYNNELIDLLHDGTFLSYVEDNARELGVSDSGLVPIIQYTYDEICRDLCQKLTSAIDE